jgi:hypothetical protein
MFMSEEIRKEPAGGGRRAYMQAVVDILNFLEERMPLPRPGDMQRLSSLRHRMRAVMARDAA